MSADLASQLERLAALVRARKPATLADWLTLADEDEWLGMLETGGIKAHQWAELSDEQRARAGGVGRAPARRDALARE